MNFRLLAPDEYKYSLPSYCALGPCQPKQMVQNRECMAGYLICHLVGGFQNSTLRLPETRALSGICQVQLLTD